MLHIMSLSTLRGSLWNILTVFPNTSHLFGFVPTNKGLYVCAFLCVTVLIALCRMSANLTISYNWLSTLNICWKWKQSAYVLQLSKTSSSSCHFKTEIKACIIWNDWLNISELGRRWAWQGRLFRVYQGSPKTRASQPVTSSLTKIAIQHQICHRNFVGSRTFNVIPL